MHFSLIACTSSFISLSLHRCALGLLQTYIVEIPSCQNHGSKSQGFCVSHSLVHDIKWKGGEGEKILFHCLQSCTCLYLTFVVVVIGAVCVVSRVCDPTLAWCFHGCFHWGFHWRSPRCSPPPHKRGSLSWIGHCLRREQGGLLKPAGSLSVLLSW